MKYDFLEADDLITRSVLVLEDDSKVLVIRDSDNESKYNNLIYEDGQIDELGVIALYPEDGNCDSKGDWVFCLAGKEITEIHLPCDPSDFIKDPFCIKGKLVTDKNDLLI